jgi:uncharacterized protein YecT (DUF1311 family)
MMRNILFYFLLGLSSFAFSESNGNPSESPQSKAYTTKQNVLRARGSEALAAEYTREKTFPCKEEESSNGKDECVSRDLQVTQKNYESYTKAIGDLLRLRDPDDPDAASYPDRGKELDRAELLWVRYREVQCQAVSDSSFGGTIQPLISLFCKQGLTRSHMHELGRLYSDLWN